jgi:hypothetical protein
MKMRDFWDTGPCSLVDLTDVSDVYTVSISSAMSHDVSNTGP